LAREIGEDKLWPDALALLSRSLREIPVPPRHFGTKMDQAAHS
jgi:hypothetical protein